MKAIVCHAYSGYRDLRLEQDWPEPECPPDGVVIETRAAGVSFALQLVVAGRYQRRPPLPFIPGTEVAGLVVKTGPQATGYKPGDRVFAAVDWGGLAQFSAVRPENLHPIPEGMDFAEAVTLPNSYGTAHAAVLFKGQLQAGETVLIHGAAGAVGLAAIEIAKTEYAQVIGTAGSPAKIEAVLARGADHAINYRQEDFRERVKALTGGLGADLILDMVGGEVMAASLRCCAPEGRIITIGYASGEIPQIPANLLLVKNISVIGLNYGTYQGWSPGDNRGEFVDLTHGIQESLADLYREGLIRPTVCGRYPLSGFQAAMDRLLAREVIGKLVVEPWREP